MFELFFLQPFSYIQYIYLTTFILLKNPLIGIFLIAINFVTSTINYIFIWVSFKKIKQMAERREEVEVLREGQWRRTESWGLVPGDIYRPGEEIVCDGIVMKEDLFVSEVGFTGESTPIGKFAISDKKKTY